MAQNSLVFGSLFSASKRPVGPDRIQPETGKENNYAYGLYGINEAITGTPPSTRVLKQRAMPEKFSYITQGRIG